MHGIDKDSVANEKRTSCGTCARVCPVKNIAMVNEKPFWLHHCELCLACMHLCPVAAIQMGSKIAFHGRYKNPSLSRI